MLNKSSKKYARDLKSFLNRPKIFSNELYKNQSIKSKTFFSMPIVLKLKKNKNRKKYAHL